MSEQQPKETRVRYIEIKTCFSCPHCKENKEPPKPFQIWMCQGFGGYYPTRPLGAPAMTVPDWCPLPCSRPHPAPAFKRCCDSCINVPCKVLNRVPCLAQEKQENVCEENGCTDIENCDEICQHSRLFSPLQMQEAKDAAARAAQEDVLKEIRKKYVEFNNHPCPELADKYGHACDSEYCGICVLDEVLESLRGERR